MSLAEYRRKRHFTKTSEPSGTRVGRGGSKNKPLQYVIQNPDDSLNPRESDDDFQIYVSLGQAF